MSAVAPPAQQRSHPHAGGSGAKPKLYNPRHPEQTLLYRTVAEHFETWLELASAGQFDGQGDHHTPPVYVEQTFRSERHIRSAEHHLSPSQWNWGGRRGASAGLPTQTHLARLRPVRSDREGRCQRDAGLPTQRFFARCRCVH